MIANAGKGVAQSGPVRLERIAVSVEHPLDHCPLRKMQKDPLVVGNEGANRQVVETNE